MATKVLKINYTIPIGSYLQLGYRPIGSGLEFVRVQPNPFYNQSPYSIELDAATYWEFELKTICEECESTSSAIYIQEQVGIGS